MVFERQAEYDSKWVAMGSIVSKIGCTAETVCKWVRCQRQLEQAYYHQLEKAAMVA